MSSNPVCYHYIEERRITMAKTAPGRRGGRSGHTKTATTGQIRIIAGQWRGRKLPVQDLQGLRPTTDRVKETLFNWLATDIRDSRCLDLFAGSGSLGFESLSRGSRQTWMLETNPQAARQLQENVTRLNAGERARIIQTDSVSFLNDTGEPFDIVFIDPPFRQELVADVCRRLEDNGWLADEALIYIEHESELDALPLPANWQPYKGKQAGQVCYQLFLRQANKGV